MLSEGEKMELYYHVVHFKRGKICKFNFCLLKNPDGSIEGKAVVNLQSPLKKAEFTKESDARLKEADKKFIINSIMKHIG